MSHVHHSVHFKNSSFFAKVSILLGYAASAMARILEWSKGAGVMLEHYSAE